MHLFENVLVCFLVRWLSFVKTASLFLLTSPAVQQPLNTAEQKQSDQRPMPLWHAQKLSKSRTAREWRRWQTESAELLTGMRNSLKKLLWVCCVLDNGLYKRATFYIKMAWWLVSFTAVILVTVEGALRHEECCVTTEIDNMTAHVEKISSWSFVIHLNLPQS